MGSLGRKRKCATGLAALGLLIWSLAVGCGQGTSNESDDPNQNPSTGAGGLQGVLMWKGDTSGAGLYGSETKLTPQNVNPQQFGLRARFEVDGYVVAQPLYVSQLNMGDKGVHDVVLVATEHNSIYAFDANGGPSALLWQRTYNENNSTPAPDNYGGRTTLGGEIGITGTPVIDRSTGAMYFVTMIQRAGVIEQWLRAVDIKTGADFGPGSMKIEASVPGDGRGSVNGQIPFDPVLQNQRPGLVLLNGKVLIAWGSFSDWGLYHGWLMAYDAASLQRVAVFNPTPQHQAVDDVFGPADHGGGGAFWQGGAPPTIDAQGNIYIVASDGSFNADQGGSNYSDTVLRLQLTNSGFQVMDWFTPANERCVNMADLEIGSGGVVLLPSSAGGGRRAVVINKEGRLYVLNPDNLGKFNPAGDSQIPQQFMVGAQQCFEGMGEGHAEGADWNRLYGNPAYWAGNLYVAPSNTTLRQYAVQNGTVQIAPLAQSGVAFGFRGGGVVVSANGNSNGIVWVMQKEPSVGAAVLHAFDATSVSRELWNSSMNAPRDAMNTGTSFGVPVVADGRVIAAGKRQVSVYGLLQ